MSDQPRSVPDILMDRLAKVQEISTATAEHLRLTQEQNGVFVLEMKGDQTEEEQRIVAARLEECEAKIARLEEEVSALDQELESQNS